MTGDARSEPPRLSLSGLGRRADLALAQQQVHAFLASHSVPERAVYACELVLEECLANLFEHAQPAAPGQGVHGEVHVELTGDEVVMRFLDDAQAFDPTARAAPVLPATLDDARPGGLGLMLVQRWARRVQYARVADGNQLTVVIGNTPEGAASAP